VVVSVLVMVGGSGGVYAQGLMNLPESVVYDSVHNRYLVSNWGNGNILQIDHNGSYNLFASGLSSTGGLAIVGDTLFAASNWDVQQGVAVYDLNSGEMIDLIHPDGMQFANGLAADTSGYLYATDTFTSSIFKILLADGTAVKLVDGTLPEPNGIHFDARNNRLLVASNHNVGIKAVDINSGAITQASTYLGTFDGFGEDGLHNLYVSLSDDGNVYRFDSLLTDPPVVVSSGHVVPEGICFDRLHRTLVIPNMYGASIDFEPQDVDIWHTADSVIGRTPLEVGFSAGSLFEITDWFWDFGDGDTAVGPDPTHVYDVPGKYDITMRAVTADDDTLVRVYPNYIFSLADSLWVEDQVYGPGNPIEVTVQAINSVPLWRLTVPVLFAGDLDLVFDSFSTQGCRTESYAEQALIQLLPSSKKLTIRFTVRDPATPLYDEAGEGPLVKLYFHAESPVLDQYTVISLDGYDQQHLPRFDCYFGPYQPAIGNGTVGYFDCCEGIRGNADNDPDDQITIADLVYLVDFMFNEGSDPDCWLEANIDGDLLGDAFEQLTIADLVHLVDYMFSSGPPPASCP